MSSHNNRNPGGSPPVDGPPKKSVQQPKSEPEYRPQNTGTLEPGVYAVKMDNGEIVYITAGNTTR
jgi:hypothetical protein